MTFAPWSLHEAECQSCGRVFRDGDILEDGDCPSCVLEQMRMKMSKERLTARDVGAYVVIAWLGLTVAGVVATVVIAVVVGFSKGVFG